MSDDKVRHIKPKALNERQKRFVLLYIANGFNALKAFKEAGYSEKTAEICAYRLLGNARIKAEIEKRTAKPMERLEKNAEWTMTNIALIAERSLGGVEGYLYDAHAGLRALELIGKAQGLFQDKQKDEGGAKTINNYIQILQQGGAMPPLLRDLAGRCHSTNQTKIIDPGSSCAVVEPNKILTENKIG